MASEKVKYLLTEFSSVDDKLIEDFSCGNPELDKKIAQLKNNPEGTTYVAIDRDKNKIIAYCTFTASGLTKMYENDTITQPAAEIKYFATDEDYQHIPYDDSDADYKVSDHIFCKIIERLEIISESTLYFECIILYSVPGAVSFYKRNGFEDFSDYMAPDKYRYIEGCTPMVYIL